MPKYKLNCLKKITLLSFWIFSLFAPATAFSITGEITPCFTPGGDCAELIINDIHHEKDSILVQAYQLTSMDITKALVDAKHRGVIVKIILDKSQYTQKRYSSATFFDHADIPVWIDNKPAIAHNKIIILGNDEVLTGSYNFSKAAQEKNSENLLIIKSKALAKVYIQNFQKRLSASMMLSSYKALKNNVFLNSNNKKSTHRRHKNNSFLNNSLFG